MINLIGDLDWMDWICSTIDIVEEADLEWKY